MAKLRGVLVVLLLACLLGFGILAGFKLFHWVAFGPRLRIYNSPALLQQVQTLSQLVTVQYIIEKVELLEVPSQNLIGQALGSENRILMICHGVVKAGIDFGQMQPSDVAIDGKCVVVKLPSARITDAYLDEQETKVVDRKTGLLAPSDKDLEQTARLHAVDDIQRAARRGGILKDADDRARIQIRNLFHQLGYEKVEFK